MGWGGGLALEGFAVSDASDIAAKTGTGTTVVMSTTPTFVTSIITPRILAGVAVAFVGTEDILIDRSATNGAVFARFRNTNTGTLAESALSLMGDTASASLTVASSGFTTASLFALNDTMLSASHGLLLRTTSGAMRFAVNLANVGRVLTTGQWIFSLNDTALKSSENWLFSNNPTNDFAYMRVANANAGTTAGVYIDLYPDNGAYEGAFMATSASFTTSGLRVAGEVEILNSGGAGGIGIRSAHATATVFLAANNAKVIEVGAAKIGFYGGTPVVQGAAVADASGGAVIDAEARTALNALLARVRAISMIAT